MWYVLIIPVVGKQAGGPLRLSFHMCIHTHPQKKTLPMGGKCNTVSITKVKSLLPGAIRRPSSCSPSEKDTHGACLCSPCQHRRPPTSQRNTLAGYTQEDAEHQQSGVREPQQVSPCSLTSLRVVTRGCSPASPHS